MGHLLCCAPALMGCECRFSGSGWGLPSALPERIAFPPGTRGRVAACLDLGVGALRAFLIIEEGPQGRGSPLGVGAGTGARQGSVLGPGQGEGCSDSPAGPAAFQPGFSLRSLLTSDPPRRLRCLGQSEGSPGPLTQRPLWVTVLWEVAYTLAAL